MTASNSCEEWTGRHPVALWEIAKPSWLPSLEKKGGQLESVLVTWGSRRTKAFFAEGETIQSRLFQLEEGEKSLSCLLGCMRGRGSFGGVRE